MELEPSGFPTMGRFSCLGTSSSCSPWGKGQPSSQPCSTPYLYFIKELSIQQGQLLGYFMAVKVMQSPRPRRQRHEMSGGDRDSGSWLGAVLRPHSQAARASSRPKPGLMAGQRQLQS